MLLSLIKKWFPKRPGCSGTSSQGCPSPPSSPSSSKKVAPQRHLGTSSDIKQKQQTEFQSRFNPSSGINQAQKKSPSSGVNKTPKNKRPPVNKTPKNKRPPVNKAPKNKRPPVPQNETQSRPSSSSYKCSQKGCMRTFETIDKMDKHLSRHNGSNRRNKSK
ncbi:hypothetical protein GLOIN_2v1713610 [Rhizophagus clarus]|nr:hypothetical protein GLOIN_2v1713610 [Rhizophagus clarus]